MADTFSTLLGLRYQQTGGNTNTWGDLLNTDVFAVLELGIAGMATHAVTGGTLDLSASPLVEQVHKFTGALSSNLTVTIPNLKKTMTVWNATSGPYVILLKTASGSAVCIPQGTMKGVVCDGSNGVYRADRDRVGTITAFGGTTVPSGSLQCAGGTSSRTLLPDLFAAIGTTWGAGDGSTTFGLPDFYTGGRFLRSNSSGAGIGALQAADIAAHSHTTSSGTCSGITDNQSADHTHSGATANETQSFTHSYNTAANKVSQATGFASVGGAIWAGADTPATTGSQSANHTHTFTTGGVSANHTHAFSGTCTITVNNSTGTETRPINASVMYVIWY